LELLYQTVRLLSRNAIQQQLEPSAIENHYIGAHRMLAIDPAVDLRADGSQGNRFIARNHLQEFHATRSHAGQEYFGRCNRLARTRMLASSTPPLTILRTPCGNEVASATHAIPNPGKNSNQRRLLPRCFCTTVLSASDVAGSLTAPRARPNGSSISALVTISP